jgi:hypothetical protein
MSKKNNFLNIFLAVVVIAALALGYFLWKGMGAHKAAQADLATNQTNLRTLKAKPLYPSPENLEKRTQQVAAFRAKVDEFQKKLMAFQTPMDAKSSADAGAKFQAKLADYIKLIKDKASTTQIDVGDIKLGMNEYTTEAPIQAAVPEVDFQLEGINAFVHACLDSRIAKIETITRTPLAIETPVDEPDPDAKGKEKPRAPSRGRAPAEPAGPAIAEDKVLARYPFQIRFVGTMKSVEDVFNTVSNTQEGSQFYAVRFVRIETEKKDGPPKQSAPTFSGNEENKKSDSKVVMGGEKVAVHMAVDLLRFLDPALSKEVKEAKGDQDKKTASAN